VLRDEKDERPVFLSVIQDVTEQRLAERALRDREEQLRQAQKLEAIGQLAGGLAHEFNNTLAAIAGFASLLREDTPRDDPRREDVEDILRVTQRAGGVTRRLLALSRKQLQEFATLDLRDVLLEFETLIRPVLLSTIRITTRTPQQPVFATVNRSQIEQVLMNLSVNARDAMPDGGSLEFVLDVHTETSDGVSTTAARLRVSDTGAGMGVETLARLWEPFFTTKEGYGTGLGLPTSLAIIREHRGDLRATSTIGAGSTFALLLPLAEAGMGVDFETVSGGLLLHGSPTGQTILFAEDEDGVRITGQRLLERAGYTVLSARHGAEAWRLFLANINAIDLVLTDLMMPELNGRELIKRVKSYVADMPVIVMTGYAGESVDVSRTPGSANATLIKPFVGDVLLGTLREVLAAHRRSDRDGLALSKAGQIRQP
jgi:two-component system cell cycle sensor histidine kinase/response regulator CckA